MAGRLAADPSGSEGALLQVEPVRKSPWWQDVPFDIVIGWYNQTDPVRSQLLKQYNPNRTETCGTEPNVGEIYLSLASVQHYAPWVNTIFLVSSSLTGRQHRAAAAASLLAGEFMMLGCKRPSTLSNPPHTWDALWFCQGLHSGFARRFLRGGGALA